VGSNPAGPISFEINDLKRKRRSP